MTDESRIRPYAPGDLPRLHEIREAAFAPVFASFRKLVGEPVAATAFAGAEQEQAALLDRLCASSSDDEVYVAINKDAIVGFCAVTLDAGSGIGEIGLNAVHPDHQGFGIGASMYAFALWRMKEAGMKTAMVGTGGDASHAPARRAYEKAGFASGVPSVHLYKSI